MSKPSKFTPKMTTDVSPFVMILVTGGKVPLRDIYYNYDAFDILDMLEIVCCNSYNNIMGREIMTGELKNIKRR